MQDSHFSANTGFPCSMEIFPAGQSLVYKPQPVHLPPNSFYLMHSLGTEPYIDIFPGKDSDNKRVFERNGIHPNTQFTTTDSDLAYSMVEAGLGITMNNAAVKERSPAAETFWEYLCEREASEGVCTGASEHFG